MSTVSAGARGETQLGEGAAASEGQAAIEDVLTLCFTLSKPGWQRGNDLRGVGVNGKVRKEIQQEVVE